MTYTITYTVADTRQPTPTQKFTCDAARPWIVLAPAGFINRVKGRYATKAQAERRARDLTRAANKGA